MLIDDQDLRREVRGEVRNHSGWATLRTETNPRMPQATPEVVVTGRTWVGAMRTYLVCFPQQDYPTLRALGGPNLRLQDVLELENCLVSFLYLLKVFLLIHYQEITPNVDDTPQSSQDRQTRFAAKVEKFCQRAQIAITKHARNFEAQVVKQRVGENQVPTPWVGGYLGVRSRRGSDASISTMEIEALEPFVPRYPLARVRDAEGLFPAAVRSGLLAVLRNYVFHLARERYDRVAQAVQKDSSLDTAGDTDNDTDNMDLDVE